MTTLLSQLAGEPRSFLNVLFLLLLTIISATSSASIARIAASSLVNAKVKDQVVLPAMFPSQIPMMW